VPSKQLFRASCLRFINCYCTIAATLITGSISGLPPEFPRFLSSYHSQITDAIRKNSHHDHRRALLMDFLRKSFGIEADEIELELKIKTAEARGRIDAFYKFVIFEMKVDIERERADAMRELRKYFESRKTPEDYIAVVTDGLRFEVYDYESTSRQPKKVRPFDYRLKFGPAGR
jgi:MmeI, N-terminal domain